jgi:ATP:ADP antiporter, AAA family
VNSSGEYLFGRFIVDASIRTYGSDPASLVARQQYVGGVYAQLFGYVNLLGFLLQLFVVSRILKYLGVGRALFIHPLVVLTGYLVLLKSPTVSTMEWLKVADNSLDYSLGNTAKQALWLPTSRVAKYKAKQAVDAFFMRPGDVLSAAVVFIGESLAITVPGFAVINIARTFAWLTIVTALNSAYRAQVAAYRGTGADREPARPSPPAVPPSLRSRPPARQTAAPR